MVNPDTIVNFIDGSANTYFALASYVWRSRNSKSLLYNDAFTGRNGVQWSLCPGASKVLLLPSLQVFAVLQNM